ncbi:MAG: LuxR family transcriptional regulator [Alphaproteobacteria bacterium]|nr:LuxR family transcriptional regulator [Alphaproteobacteria bacterium]
MKSIEPFLEKIRSLDDLQAVHDALGVELNGLGFDRFAYHVLRPPSGIELGRSVLSSYPWDWLVRYKEEDYFNTDPVLGTAVDRLFPFRWDEQFPDDERSPQERQFFGEAGDFGIRDGITIPIHGPAGGIATLNLSSELSDADLRELWARRQHDLQLIAYYAHDAILRCVYASAGTRRIRLTPRERECLLWTARGKTTWEVSQVLTITENTARFHLRNAMTKLDVFSKHHAVVKAILLGIIVP